jgi:hypothetical protein
MGRVMVGGWPAPGPGIELFHTIFIFGASCFHNLMLFYVQKGDEEVITQPNKLTHRRLKQ